MTDHTTEAQDALRDLEALGFGDALIKAVVTGFSALTHAVLALNETTEAGHDKVAGQVESGLEEVAGAIVEASTRYQLNLDFPLRPVKAS